jgi:hypothetical protein
MLMPADYQIQDVKEMAMAMGGLGRAARVALIGVATMMAAIFVSGQAGAQGPVSFAIQPVNADPGSPPRAFFTYALEPGVGISDELVVVNSGSEPVTLKLFDAAAISAINGGTAFASADDPESPGGSWLATDVSELSLGPGESVTVPFDLQVPADATPGDHVEGWVVEAPPASGEHGGFGAAVIRRSGVAVVVQVPGSTIEQLVLGAICLNQESGSNYFQIVVGNQGDVMTRGSGKLVLLAEDGSQVFSREVELGTVMPSTATFLRVDAPLDPGPGSYVATLSLAQLDEAVVETSSSVEIGEEKINGCVTNDPVDVVADDVVVGDVATPAGGDSPTGAGSVGNADSSDGGLPVLTIGLIALVVLLIAGFGTREIIGRRRNGAIVEPSSSIEIGGGEKFNGYVANDPVDVLADDVEADAVVTPVAGDSPTGTGRVGKAKPSDGGLPVVTIGLIAHVVLFIVAFGVRAIFGGRRRRG